MRVIREVFIMRCQVFLPKDPVVVRKIVSTCHNLSFERTIIIRIRSVSKVVAVPAGLAGDRAGLFVPAALRLTVLSSGPLRSQTLPCFFLV